jgi:hypothetical protein
MLLTVPPSIRGLTPLSIVLLEKLRDAKRFLPLAFHGDGRLTTVYKAARH